MNAQEGPQPAVPMIRSTEPTRLRLWQALPLGLAGHGSLENPAAPDQAGTPVGEATVLPVLAVAMGRLADAAAGH